MLDTIKNALRISHTSLDGEINRLISVAKAELLRVGIKETAVESDDDLIKQAIVTYCLGQLKDEQYQESFRQIADELRKTGEYYDSEDV